MSWKTSIKEFKTYLKIERSLSDNTIDSYIRDVKKLAFFGEKINKNELKINKSDIKDFIKEINEDKISARTQSRIISGIKAFYKYLILEDYIKINPTELIESPKIGMKLPDTLSVLNDFYYQQ